MVPPPLSFLVGESAPLLSSGFTDEPFGWWQDKGEEEGGRQWQMNFVVRVTLGTGATRTGVPGEGLLPGHAGGRSGGATCVSKFIMVVVARPYAVSIMEVSEASYRPRSEVPAMPASVTNRKTPCSTSSKLRPRGGWCVGGFSGVKQAAVAKQVECPECAADAGAQALLSLCQDSKDEDEYDDHDGQRKCSRVAVEEHNVSGILAISDDGVTSEVPGLSVLPDTPRRVESCAICHRGHKGGQQQEV
uniref:Uncharacterized protein n=2 Tax=Oryza punctata TaxID=4537 RepID=A0A0E0LAM7_ORYPU